MSKLKDILRERGISTTEFAKGTGISKSTVSEWCNGKYTPRSDKLLKASEYLGVPIDYLLETDAKVEESNKPVRALFELAAGQGCINGSYPTEFTEDEDEEDASWCVINGDSMSPELKDGDQVLVKHMTETRPQDMTVIKVDGESSTVKFVEITNTGVWIRALNKNVFEDKFYTVLDVLTLPIKIIGKVVEVRRRY